MSRIFDAIKYAQLLRKGDVAAKPAVEEPVEVPDRRRSRRLILDVSVFVYGHGPEKEPFHEEARTLNVNANGALLLLSGPVRTGQRLLLTNEITQKEQDCRVIFVGVERGAEHVEQVEAGIAFAEANPEFWQSISAPAPNDGPEPAA
jgi:hypothetical protein